MTKEVTELSNLNIRYFKKAEDLLASADVGDNDICFTEEITTAMPIGAIYPLACSANYVPEGSLPCDGAEYTKAQFNDLWENYLTSEETETTYILNNCISVVGELASQQGIYSGFADGKYLTVNIPEILAGESVIYTFKYNAGSDVTTYQDLFDTDIDPATKYLKLSNGKFVLSGTIQNTLDISPNSPFYIRLLISNTTLNIYVSKDGTNYYNLTAWNISNITSVNLGVLHNYGDPYTPFLGNIDLASSTLTYESGDTVNLAEIKTVQKTLLNTCTYSEYDSDISTYGQCGKFAVKPLAFDSSKITIVGTPTITDDGVASGFSSSNYLIAPVEINLLNYFTAECSFTYKTKDQESMIWCYNLNCYLSISKSGFSLKYPTGTSSESATSTFLSIPLTDVGISEGDIVYSKVTLSPNKISLTINSVVKELDANINWGYLQKYTSANGIKLGNANAYQEKYYFTGSIDLKQFSITVDGKEVYNCVSGNTFKVPTIKDGAYITQAKSDTELGKSYNESLPSSTYQDNAKVQGDNVRMRYFVVVATGSVNESQMNWSEWASSLQGKANTDLNNLSDNGKKVIDGQWISSPHLLSSATATGTYTIDLSSYLPNDNCTYEVILNIKTYHTANCNVTVYTNDFPPFEFSSKTYTTDIGQNARSQANTFILPVSQKQVLMKIGTAKASENYLSMIAYRRIGTNV